MQFETFSNPGTDLWEDLRKKLPGDKDYFSAYNYLKFKI